MVIVSGNVVVGSNVIVGGSEKFYLRKVVVGQLV